MADQSKTDELAQIPELISNIQDNMEQVYHWAYVFKRHRSLHSALVLRRHLRKIRLECKDAMDIAQAYRRPMRKESNIISLEDD